VDRGNRPGRPKQRGSPRTDGPRPQARSDLPPETMKHIVDLLRNASQQEVCSILDQIGFQQNLSAAKLSRGQFDAVVVAEAKRFLATPKGQAEFNRSCRQLIESEAQRFLDSTEGRRRVEEAVAAAGAQQVRDDDDLLNRCCREAARQEVETWLRSERGKQTVANMLERVIDEQILELSKRNRSDWIQRKLREFKRGEREA